MKHPSHSNFRDPLGLLWRMVTSGNRAAYSALMREAASLAVSPVDVLLSMLERRRKATGPADDARVVLVIGAPRSGTTLVYQVLAHFLDVSFPSNLNALFPRAPLAALQIERKLPLRRHADFSSFYGQTSSLSGPNDAFHIWNRWLGQDRYEPLTDLSEQAKAEMREFFHVWQETTGKPFLNKNNRNTTAMATLADALPGACFVVVHRNPLFVVQSLIRARQQVQGNKAEGWGLRSASTRNRPDPLAYVDDVCQQVLSIETAIGQQLAQITDRRVFETDYEEFCSNPSSVVRNIADCFGLSCQHETHLQQLPPFSASRRLTLSSEELQRAESVLQQHTLRRAEPAWGVPAAGHLIE